MNDQEGSVDFRPNHLDLYLLVLGLFLGIILGPGVLGRVGPRVYDRVWVGSGEGIKELENYDRQSADVLRRMTGSGVTEAAVAEKRKEIDEGRLPLDMKVGLSRNKHLQRLAGLSYSLVAVLCLMMVLEAVVSGEGVSWAGAWRGRMTTVRYSLAGAWMCVQLAQPALLKGTPVGLVVVVGAVALVVGLLPVERGLMMLRRGGK